MAPKSCVEPDFWAFVRRLADVEPHVPSDGDPPSYEEGVLYEVDDDSSWRFVKLHPPRRWMPVIWFAFIIPILFASRPSQRVSAN